MSIARLLRWFFAPARQQKTWKPVRAKLVLDVLEDRFAPAVLLVGTASTEYHTIHSAVSAANSGDIVLVDPGTYQEQVTITKSIELMPHYGSNNGQTIIESPTNLGAQTVANPDAIVHVTGSGVNAVVEGFTIEGASASGTANLLYGIRVDGNAVARINENTITNIINTSNYQTGVAISVGNGAASPDGLGPQVGGASMISNIITNYQRAGVVVNNTGSWGVLELNTITATSTPLTTVLASSVTGVEISGGASGTLAFNTISNNYNDSAGTGVFLNQPGQGTELTQNTIKGNDYGVFALDVTSLVGAYAHSYYDGYYVGGSYGSFVGGSYGNRGVSFDRNTITGNTFVGIELDTSTGLNISNNTISSNGGTTYYYEDAGLLLVQSTNTAITGNQSINNNGSGIFLDAGSTGNTVTGNSFTGNYYFDSTDYLFASADAVDLSVGTSTAGTSNIWVGNVGATYITLSGTTIL